MSASADDVSRCETAGHRMKGRVTNPARKFEEIEMRSSMAAGYHDSRSRMVFDAAGLVPGNRLDEPAVTRRTENAAKSAASCALRRP
jgi:hypothetical protein